MNDTTLNSNKTVTTGNGDSKNFRMSVTLVLITISVFMFTGIFEILMDYLHPDETVWESHLTTIVFSSCVAALSSYFVLKNYEALLLQINRARIKKEQAERILERTIAELQSLHAITNDLLELDDPSQVLDTIARGIVNHLNYEIAVVGQCSRTTGEIEQLAVFPLTDAATDLLAQFKTGKKPEELPDANRTDTRVVDMLNNGKRICHDPKNLFLQLASEMNLPIKKESWLFPATIGAALKIKGETAGIILAGGTDELVRESAHCLERLTNPAAIALENARLFNFVCNQSNNLRELRNRLEEAEETEKKRLARELHDQIGQNLTAIGINLSILNCSLGDKAAEIVSSRLNDSMGLLEETTARIRGVMADLEPPGLKEFGLCWTMERFCRQFSERTGIAVTFSTEELELGASFKTERALFRIVQEAFSNISRHAKAGNVFLTLVKSGEALRMHITDDGCGFDPGAIGQNHHPRWGLKIMRERAILGGGTLSIDSTPGAGTKILVEVRNETETDYRFSRG